MKTLHVTDLDGTLVSSAGSLSNFTVSTINELIDRDELDLTYATARSFLSAKAIIARCHFRLPAAVYGGAFLVDPSGEFIESHYLESSVLEEIVAVCRARGLPPLVYRIENGRDFISWVGGEENEGMREYLSDRGADRRFVPVDTVAGLRARHPFYLSVIGDTESIGRLAADVGAIAADQVSIVVQNDTYHPHRTWLEVTARQANKAIAVQRLRGLTDAERVVCFGDNLNDLPMFAEADLALAVGNAVDEARAAADAVISTNDDDGVAHWLAEHH